MIKNDKGALLIAKNNTRIDYIKQAVFSANRIKRHLNIPVSIITNNTDHLSTLLKGNKVFDKVIEATEIEKKNIRSYFDGSLTSKNALFNNFHRAAAYHHSPYAQTLLLDVDYIVCNDLLTNCFDNTFDLMAFKNSYGLSSQRQTPEFERINDHSIDFWWATVLFFKKTPMNEIFFDLMLFIEQEWHYYRKLYQVESSMFRNDYALSIANHIIGGFISKGILNHLPGKHFYTIDRDILEDIDQDSLLFLLEKKDRLGEYTAVKTENQSVHVMNKFSLERLIDREPNNG